MTIEPTPVGESVSTQAVGGERSETPKLTTSETVSERPRCAERSERRLLLRLSC